MIPRHLRIGLPPAWFQPSLMSPETPPAARDRLLIIVEHSMIEPLGCVSMTAGWNVARLRIEIQDRFGKRLQEITLERMSNAGSQVLTQAQAGAFSIADGAIVLSAAQETASAAVDLQPACIVRLL